MSYDTAISRMFALGHELAQTPSHKFDLAHMQGCSARSITQKLSFQRF